jgi:ribokinase
MAVSTRASQPSLPAGAGDAFCAAFAVGLAEGLAVTDALRLASAAGAFTVGRMGAEPALPRRADVAALLARGAVEPRAQLPSL